MPEHHISEHIAISCEISHFFGRLGGYLLLINIPLNSEQFENKSKDNRGVDGPIEVREAYNGGNLSWNIISRRDRESLVPPILLNIVRLA